MKTIIFDLDGTLINSAPDLHAAANKMLTTFNKPPLSLKTITSFIGNGVPKLVERCLAASDLSINIDAVTRYLKFYDANPFTLTRPYPNVVNTLQKLRMEGAKLAICTNKPQASAQIILDGLNLTQFFDVLVGGDTYPTMKPEPAPLLGCAQKLGGSNPLYVGDSETDADTAINAKMDFALFSGGYRKSLPHEIPHDFLFSNFADLATYVRFL